MAEDETEAARRRRRRSSSRKKAATWPEYWRSAEFGRHLFVAMSLLGAVYAGATLQRTRVATFQYADLWLAATQGETRYMLGQPDRIEAGGSLYRYSDKGEEIAARFSSGGQLISISCAAGAQQPSTCPKVRGIGIGTTEDQILLRLGAPSRASFQGNDKTIYYDGMGLSFRLRLFKVREMELREGGSLIGYLPHALLAMIP